METDVYSFAFGYIFLSCLVPAERSGLVGVSMQIRSRKCTGP